MPSTLKATALTVACALTLVGCNSSPAQSSKDSTGVTDTTVTIGAHVPLTGVAAPGYSGIAPAEKAYFDYVNAHGGVHGRKIIFKYRDDAYDPAKATAVVHKLIERDHVFAIFSGLGTPTHSAVADYINARKVPDLLVASGCSCWDQPTKLPYTFGFPTSYIREGKILGSHIKTAFPGKRIAYIYQTGQTGQDELTGLSHYVPDASVVARQSYTPGKLDITPQMATIFRARPDVIVVLGIPQYLALVREAQIKAGNHAQLVANYPSSDPKTLAALLSHAVPGQTGNSLIQGIITDGFLPSPGASTDPWITLFTKIRNQYAPTQPLSFNLVFGMAAAYTFVQALQAAGPNPTRQSITDAMQNSRFTGPGLTPFGFSSNSHAGYTGVQIGTIRGDAISLQGQPLTTDEHDGPVTPYTAPAATPPASGIPG
ncbi:ABC transporter substrate-binding protein [Streptomyces sp. NPDC005529]|uniref:ABC transporter substrate-binding protein n=1 Tax=unclassified Streptomyces TaxID=2593676 RepID=UPI00339DDFF2